MALALCSSAQPVKAAARRNRYAAVAVRATLSGPLNPRTEELALLPARLNRRVLLAGAAWLIMPCTPLKVSKARAEDGEVKQLKGYALPPDSYMGYEQNATYDAKYLIQYPADWVVDKPTKTEKSTMGMDTRVHDAKVDSVEAFVIALSGPDYRGTRLDKDPLVQLRAMATSDFELRDALTNAVSLTAEKGKVQGTEFYFYDLEAPKMHYLSSMAIDPEDGTLYTLIAKAPAGRMWDKNQDKLKQIQQSFKLL